MALVPDPTLPVSLPRTQGHEESDGNSSWSASPSSSPSLTAPAPRAGAAAVEITIEEAAGDAAAGEAERGRCPRAALFSSSSPVSRRQPSATTRRDPRRAELFRSLAASSFARRLDPPSPPLQPPPPPPPPKAEDPDLPLWPPNTAAWRLFRYLRANNMESSPANHAPNPNENSVSPPPSKKSRKMLPDKDGDRCDDDEHSSESASHQIVLYKNDSSDRGQDEQGENHFSHAPSNPSKGGLTIGVFTVQCAKCFKWRLIPTQEKYEEIRERIQREPFVCERAREWKPDVTCDDPTDLSQDDSRIWAIDKPNIAQAPRGWERLVIIRKEGSSRFADVYYISPSGKKLRSTVDVEKYLAENPEHAVGVEMTQFSFKIPAPLQPDYVKKRPPQLRPSDGAHTGSTKPPQLEYVLPLAWAAAAHEDLADYRLVPYNEDPPKLLQGEPPLEKNKGSPKSGAV